MSRGESEIDYEWTYYELSDDSDPISTFNKFVKEESLGEGIRSELVPVDLTNKNEKIDEFLSDPPWTKYSTDNEDSSPRTDEKLRRDIGDVCERHQDSKQWFEKQNLERKIEIIMLYEEGEVEADDSIPDGIVEWFDDLSNTIGDINSAREVTAGILQEKGFEEKPVAIIYLESIRTRAAKDLLLTNPETIVLILQTGYIILEIIEKQYKYKPHKKVKEKSPNIKSKLKQRKKESIDKEVVGKTKVKDEVQSTLDEYHED